MLSIEPFSSIGIKENIFGVTLCGISYTVARLVSFSVTRLRFSLPITAPRIPLRAAQPQPIDEIRNVDALLKKYGFITQKKYLKSYIS